MALPENNNLLVNTERRKYKPADEKQNYIHMYVKVISFTQKITGLEMICSFFFLMLI
jgi:hypothetical protein